MYAHATNGVVDALGAPPRTAWDGTRWWDLRKLDSDALAATGWYPVTETPRPEDASDTTHDLSYEFADGAVTQVWTPRPKTSEELAAEAQQATDQLLRGEIKLIRDDLQAEKARVDAVIIKANNQITGADTKDVARAAKRIADAAISIARLLDGKI